MSCQSLFRLGLTPTIRHATLIAARPSLLLSCARTFHDSRADLNSNDGNTVPFSSFLSQPKIPSHQNQGIEGNSENWKEFDVMLGQLGAVNPYQEEYHLHIYSTKHNTHITFTDPKKNSIISMSTGNIGFKKSHRGSYDAAYQLAATVFAKLEEKGITPKNLEVVLRDFGEGREAVLKALLGNEGRNLKGAIRRVTDATRVKFGGTRSKKPRRLG
ncbi:hypothetical protein BDZ91DRAFT_694738 [Kalaharituber pfeilii]|nr:hypothetical protein BDZ91DRAFT_694738 [Kalaharituber pfeilii]